MIDNRVKQNHAEGRPSVNCWLAMGSPFAAEVLAEQGFDSLTVDMQHGMNDYKDAVAQFQAIRASGATPLARVPWLEPGIVMRTLDAGAFGVICPMINNREQAERLVSYVRYPPAGCRSFGPTRAVVSVGPDYYKHANDHVMCLAMVETREGFENVDEIVSTPGLDGIYIGPADLTIGLTDGRLPPGFDSEEDEIVDATKRILEATNKAGLLACLHCGTPEYAARAIGWGFGLVTISTDARLLAAYAKERLESTRSLAAGEATGSGVTDTGSY